MVSFGSTSRLLSNSLLVFVGEISYSLYLVHWPIVSFIRINEGLRGNDALMGIVLSVIIAIAVHFGLERLYLKWDKKLSIIVICLLFLTSIGVFHYTKELNKRVSDRSNGSPLPSFYRNLTTEQLIEIGKDDLAKDQERLFIPSCHYEKADNWDSFCTVQNETFSGNKTLLVMGNSWAANVGQIIVDECKNFTSAIFVQAVPSCEVLVKTNTWFCDSYEKRFLQALENVRPDVLFIAERHLNLAEKSATVPDPLLPEINERVEKIGKLVAGNIYIVRSFPVVSNTLLSDVVLNLQNNNTKISHESYYSNDTISIVEERLTHVLNVCPKCQLIDYKQQFTKNGVFQVFDEEIGLSYVSGGLHFTPLGLDFLRPVYREVCNNFGGNTSQLI